jgi:hypothetical protein
MTHGPRIWGTARIFYYERDKTALLLDAVKPILNGYSGGTSSAYFVRHWHRGSHVRLRFEADAEVFDRVVRPAVEMIAGGYLAALPSKATIDPDEQLRQHKRLATLEGERAALTPLAADNSILFDAPGPVERTDNDSKEYLLSDFYADTTPLVFEMLEAIRSGMASQNDLAFEAMIGVAHKFYPSPYDATIREGFISFRSHSEAYIATTPNDAAVRRQFHLESKRRLSILSRRVRELVSELDAGEIRNPFLDAWLLALRKWVSKLISTKSSLFRDGHFGGVSSRWGGDWIRRSEFHATIAQSKSYRTLLFESPWFLKYRLALNLTYLHLNRLGVLPVERYLLCHLLADAVEQAYAISALEMVRGYSLRGGS